MGISIPVFFLAYLLKYVFAVKLGWLPRRPAGPTRGPGRRTPPGFYVARRHRHRRPGRAFWDAIQHLILPGIALGTIPLAVVIRITRAAVLEVENEDYVRTAEAKGLRRRVDRPAGTC